MEIYIVRHGQTIWNAENLLQGCADIELNANGRILAGITGKSLENVDFDVIYSSPLIRAYETAALIRGYRNIPIIRDENLKEINFGAYEGKNFKKLMADDNSGFRYFFERPELYRASEDGESLENICKRAESFMQEVIEPQAEKLERVMIVAHGAMNKAIMCYVEENGIDKFWSGGVQKNCGVIILRYDENGYSIIEDSKVFYNEEDVSCSESVQAQNGLTETTFISTVMALSEAVDAKDRYTSGHSRRVAEYSKMIARRMGKDNKEIEHIYFSGLLHDIGKIRIPEEIINKPGKLTDEEYEVIKIHSVTGYHILKRISNDADIALAAKFHHERYDGKGYPNGLQGENIPELARIIGVADAYDAMASNRSYRDALPQEVVRNEIIKGKGAQFDPEIADIMLEIMNEDNEYKLKQNDNLEKTILIIDDEIINIRIVNFILKEEPMYSIISANSGMEALKILENTHVDLILLDIEMPEMNGFETLKKIQEKEKVPVVFMTADKQLETIQRAREMGVDDYITKPFLALALKEVVRSILK